MINNIVWNILWGTIMFIQYEIHSENRSVVAHISNWTTWNIKYNKKKEIKEHGKSVENKSRHKSETFTGNNNKIIEFLFSHSVIISHLCLIWEWMLYKKRMLRENGAYKTQLFSSNRAHPRAFYWYFVYDSKRNWIFRERIFCITMYNVFIECLLMFTLEISRKIPLLLLALCAISLHFQFTTYLPHIFCLCFFIPPFSIWLKIKHLVYGKGKLKIKYEARQNFFLLFLLLLMRNNYDVVYFPHVIEKLF